MKSRVETNTKLVISVLITSCLVIPRNRDLMYVTWPVDNKTVHHYTQQNSKSLRLDGYGAFSTQPRIVSAMFLVRKPYLAFDWAPTLGARGFSCAVSGLGQVLESDPREPFVSSACGRRNEAPRRMREKTSGTQGTEHQAIARQSAVSAERGPDLAFPPPPPPFCLKKIQFLIKIFYAFTNPAPYPRSRKCLPEFQWKCFFSYYGQAVLDIIYFTKRIVTYS